MYTYKNIECKNMTEEDINNTSKLFSENYGIWSKESKINPGKRIVLKPARIKKDFVDKPDRYIAMVFYNQQLIGYAFYMRRTVKKSKIITWILQLVVDEKHRGNSIGTKILHSIFGLSDSFACGLYTSNPMTIKALENATFRRIDERKIAKNINILKIAAEDLFDNLTWIDNYQNGVVDTNFYVDHSILKSNIDKVYPNKDFPFNKDLNEGCEWLAFVFKSQIPLIDNQQQLDILTEYSDDIIKVSYSYMNMNKQAWTKHTENEVQMIIKNIQECSKILDLGCGQGRISNSLSEKGYNVTAIDFVEENIKKAKENNNSNVQYIVEDARNFRSNTKYDVCLAMYDVIGSFPNEKDNIKIIARCKMKVQ